MCRATSQYTVVVGVKASQAVPALRKMTSEAVPALRMVRLASVAQPASASVDDLYVARKTRCTSVMIMTSLPQDATSQDFRLRERQRPQLKTSSTFAFKVHHYSSPCPLLQHSQTLPPFSMSQKNLISRVLDGPEVELGFGSWERVEVIRSGVEGQLWKGVSNANTRVSNANTRVPKVNGRDVERQHKGVEAREGVERQRKGVKGPWEESRKSTAGC